MPYASENSRFYRLLFTWNNILPSHISNPFSFIVYNIDESASSFSKLYFACLLLWVKYLYAVKGDFRFYELFSLYLLVLIFFPTTEPLALSFLNLLLFFCGCFLKLLLHFPTLILSIFLSLSSFKGSHSL